MNTQTQKQDVNSSVNQQIKSNFVSREVYCNVNSLVEYCLKHGFEDSDSPVNLDEIENYYETNTDDLMYEILKHWDEKKNEFKEYSNDKDTYNRRVKTKGDFEVFLKSLDESELQTFCEDFSYDYPESEPQEIFEWWAVSSYLYDKLKEQGEPVVDAGSCYIWGRTTTGQAILLDGVISRICSDMEILDGQAHSWAK